MMLVTRMVMDAINAINAMLIMIKGQTFSSSKLQNSSLTWLRPIRNLLVN